MRDRVIMSRISALVAEFGRGRSVPEQKFLRDLVFGILCSQSSLLSEIARAICHEENVQTLDRRLDVNLGSYGLTWAYEKAQSKMLSRVDSSYLLIFDPSEVIKPFAKKMEALHLVRDASEKPRLVKDELTGKRKEMPVLRPLLLKREKFGSKSERFISPDQLVFNEIEKEAATLPLDQATETITYERQKGRRKKKAWPENLPREEKLIDLSEAEKICPHDGSKLKEIGQESTEKLKVIPAQMSLVVEIKKKYACMTCEGHMEQAKSNSILPGTIATLELLSFIIFSKFFQALPLYRLEELFKLKNVHLTVRHRLTRNYWLHENRFDTLEDTRESSIADPRFVDHCVCHHVFFALPQPL